MLDQNQSNQSINIYLTNKRCSNCSAVVVRRSFAAQTRHYHKLITVIDRNQMLDQNQSINQYLSISPTNDVVLHAQTRHYYEKTTLCV